LPKRRGHNEGSIYKETKKLANGTTAIYWRGEVSLGFDQQGNRRLLRLKGKSRAEVQQQVTQAIADLQKGLPINPSKTTVAEYLTRWLDDSVRHSVRPRTYSSYAMNVTTHIGPALGTIPLKKLTAADVQGFYSRKLESGLSPRTVQYLHAILHRALEQAVKWGYIARNVTDAVDKPRVTRGAMATLSADEARRFLGAAVDDRFFALYVLAISTGMRQGELLGLTWPNVDLDAGQIHVVQQLQYNRQDRRLELVETKSGKGRNVALTQLAVSGLKEQRRMQLAERLAIADVWQNDWNLVFTTQIGSPVSAGNMLRRSFYPLLTKAELPRLRFHDLRHTAATLLLIAGEHPRVVQEMLGHASIALTLDTYSHVVPSMQKAAAAKMQSILE
jgi:integrase